MSQNTSTACVKAAKSVSSLASNRVLVMVIQSDVFVMAYGRCLRGQASAALVSPICLKPEAFT